ncbi:molybdopterin-synthase adenylyltransferase MoeB [Algivirga pacifica]|uniref:Molybdopterin-synthase adenylyltransferase MoeB n=1 Tax=Algivirga pacifica TaxID=1162670 RepID=A0ABP9DP61_9BACT
MLSKEERLRYDRHLLLPEFGEEAQLKLKEGAVLVIGAGGLGCPVLQYLTAAGVGHIGIIDHDKVDISNLQRQVLYTTTDIGRSKAVAAAQKLEAMNPLVRFTIHEEKLDASNALHIFEQYDVIVDCTDNFPTRYLANDACVLSGKPLVYGAIFKFEGQVSVFNYQEGPTYRCLFPTPPEAGSVPSCSEIGVIGVLPGIVGTLQANETLKILTGLGEVLGGKLLVLNALSMAFNSFNYQKNPEAANIKELIDYEFFCGLKNKNTMDEITVEEFDKRKGNDNFTLIDVREVHEHKAGNVGGMNIPLSLLPLRHHEIPTDKDVILYCQRGGRSMQALQWLKKNSNLNTNILSIQGGYEALTADNNS